MSYNELVNIYNSKDEDGDGLWIFKDITDHRKAGRDWEVKVLWDTGEETWEPMKVIKLDDKMTLAAYAKRANLTDIDGWKWARRLTRDPSKFIRMAKIFVTQAKKIGAKFKYGVQVPRSYREAMLLDQKNGNNLWKEAIQKEMNQILDFKTFKPLKKGTPVPKGYTRIPVHLCFDVKFDLRRKARLVGGGNWTEVNSEESYAGVVSIDTVRLAFLLGDLNGLSTMAADIGNAYLHGYTKEKVYTVAGPEFGPDLEGLIMICIKSLYGLKSSMSRWREALADKLILIGFTPSKADPDLWIRDAGTHYEYIAVYSDDVLVFSKNPLKILRGLEALFPLKGVGEPEYYLEGDIGTTKDGKYRTLSAKTYIKNCCDKIEKLYEVTLRNYGSPLEAGFHPETDTTPLLIGDSISKYRMLVGCANWAVTLGRWDIHFAVSTMGRFNAAPREGHEKAMLRIFGYLKHSHRRHVTVDTRIPEAPNGDVVDHDWEGLYPGAKEEVPADAPKPKGKPVVISVYFDSDHAHDLETRRSVTGVLLFVNKTPVQWYSKRQNTIETSTYGSELVAARIATELALALRYRLRVLGVPILGPALLYGDNMSVIINCSLPSSTLKKKHLGLCYNKVREACAAKAVRLIHVPSKENISDLLTKALGPQQHYPLLKIMS